MTNAFSPVWLSDGASLSPAAPNHIGMSRNGVEWDLIPKTNLGITQVFSANPGQYPFNTQTTLVLLPVDGREIPIELQVEQSMGKNSGSLADLTAAVKIVGNWVVNV